MNILIVDDELVSRKKMEKIMQAYGSCQAVESGTAAIKAYTQALLNEERIDLITLDVSMPDMGGPEVLTMIRNVERKNAIAQSEKSRVLMVTAMADEGTVMASIEAGCDDYIVKPFTAERVARKLGRMGILPPLTGEPAETH